MIESMEERMNRIIKNCDDVGGFGYAIKCRTHDGLNYTIQYLDVYEDECPANVPLSDYVAAKVRSFVIEASGKHQDDFCYSTAENVAIRWSSIDRVWAEPTCTFLSKRAVR